MKLSIVLVEPFYGGSHQYWCDNLAHHSKHDIHLLTLSDTHWKWRMEGGAIHLAEEFSKLNFKPDLILTTDMLNVSLFKSLLSIELQSIPICLYFHENQLTYPIQVSENDGYEKRDYHYGFMNYTSALVSNAICFNSFYNQNGFLKQAKSLLRRMPDKKGLKNIDQLVSKSKVIPVGISDDVFDLNFDDPKENETPVILWNHRWEYDKNPTTFFDALVKLKKEKIKFELIICGEHTSNAPTIFKEAKDLFKEEIIHAGYVENRSAYLSLLRRSNVLLVTSLHEFFGISVLEACILGCIPILPMRLSYPEIFHHEEYINLFYHNEDELFDLLVKTMIHPYKTMKSKELLAHYKMSNLIKEYDEYFNQIVDAKA